MRRRRLATGIASFALVTAGLSAVPVPAAHAATTSPATSGVDYRFVSIDVPGGHGQALAVSANRTVVGLYYVNAVAEQPFVFDEQHGSDTLSLDDGMRNGVATRISDDGNTIVGWEESDTGQCSVVSWRKETGGGWGRHLVVTSPHRQDLNFVGCDYLPVAVTDDGTIAISTATTPITGGPAGLLWKNGTLSQLPAQPHGIGATGEVFGAIAVADGTVHPWGSKAGQLTLPPGARSAAAERAAPDGTMLVTSDAGNFQRQPDGTYLRLETLTPASGAAPHAYAHAESDHAEIVGDSTVAVVGSSVGTDLTHAVRWNSDGTVTDLNDVVDHTVGETLLRANAVNKGGDVVGGAATTAYGGIEAPMLLVAMPPIIFVPGVAGSHLVDLNGNELWVGCGSDHAALALNPDGSSTAYADDVLRDDTCFKLSTDDLKAYGPFIDSLKKNGGLVEYAEDHNPSRWTTAGCDTSQRSHHPNLFLLPYDWRQSNAVSAKHLADLMGCVRKFYTGPVVIAAHSMGSLISRRYILEHPADSHHVRDLVTIGAPWLGAPKLPNALETGEFAPVVLPSTMRQILPTMPGPGQLLPTSAYYSLAGSVFTENGYDINGNGTDKESYSQQELDALLDAQYAGHDQITAQANAFHAYTTAEGSQDDWRADSTDVNYTVMYGVHTEKDTIGRVDAITLPSCRARATTVTCTLQNVIDTTLTDGDGTVPLTSSTRKGNGLDLNNGDHEKLIPVYGAEWSDDLTEHTGLTRNPYVQRTVLVTDGRPAPLVMQAAKAAAATTGGTSPQWVVDVQGADGAVAVQGPDGTTDIGSDGQLVASLPGVTHLPEGSGAELDVVPDHGAYAVNFHAGPDGLRLDARHGDQQAPAVTDKWIDLDQVPAGRLVTLAVDGDAATLRYDADGDGAVDTALDPTMSLAGKQALDVTPPTVTATATVQSGTRQVALAAADDSGVARVMWSLDGKTFQRYDGPIGVGATGAPLYVFADDVNGNRSGIQHLDPATLAVVPYTTFTTFPATGDNGWSQSPFTVYLKAHASDGRTIASLSWKATTPDGASRSGTVADASASIPVTAANTRITYHATDSAGSVEPEQYRVVGVDSAPPTATVTEPADRAQVRALPKLTGTASDDASGVTDVRVALQRNSDGRFWNGTDWVTDREQLSVSGADSWTVTSPLPQDANLTAGAYTVQVTVTDAAGRSAEVVSGFTIGEGTAFTPLNPPAGYAAANTYAMDITEDGRVGGTLDFADCYDLDTQAMRWDADGTAHPVVAGSPTKPAGCQRGTTGAAISSTGSVAGLNTNALPALWRADGTAVKLDPYMGCDSSVHAINSSDTVVGSECTNGWEVWRPDGSRMPIPWPSDFVAGLAHEVYAQISHTTDINDAGQVVATLAKTAGNLDYRPAAVMGTTTSTKLIFPPASPGADPPLSGALGINVAGDIVGWGGVTAAPGSNGYTLLPPFLRTADGKVQWFDLENLGMNCGLATASNSAHIVVGMGTSRGCPTTYTYPVGPLPMHLAVHWTGNRAFVIKNGVPIDLTSLLPANSGWVLNEAWGINDQNQIVGTGTYNGKPQGFVLTLGAAKAVAQPPLLADTTVSTGTGQPVRITVPMTTAGSATVTGTVVAGPEHGTVSAPEGNVVTYTPAAGFTGTDSFQFRVDDGVSQSDVVTVTVNVGPPPTPPALAAVISGPAYFAEGGSVVLDASDSVDPAGGTLSYDWDVNGDGKFGDATTPTVTVTLPDDGSVTVAVKVTGPSGTVETSRVITALNVAPVVSVSGGGSVGLGQTFHTNGRFADSGADTWTGTVDLGDGTAPQPLKLTGVGNSTFVVNAKYARAGYYTVTIRVCDSDGGCGQHQIPITVRPNPGNGH